VIGVERDGLPIGCDCAGKVVLKAIRVAEIVVIVSGAGIASDRRVNESLGLDVVAVLLCHDSEQVECVGVIRFQAQDIAVARLSLGEIAGLVVCQAAREHFARGCGALSSWRSFGSQSQHRELRDAERSKPSAKKLRPAASKPFDCLEFF
jgi:hypothetical protein